MNTGRRAAAQEDYTTARRNYEELAEFGIPDAKVELGKMYLYGRGADADPQKAMSLFEEAKASGSPAAARLLPKAQGKVGSLALNGKSSVSSAQGLKMLEQAASNGDTDAMIELGNAYQNGTGVQKNGAMADRYYLQASAKNAARADYHRAKLYQKGELVPKDINLAMQLYQSSGRKGYGRAWLELGKIYEKGQETGQDYQKAADFYTLAMQNGLPAGPDLERVQGKLGNS